MKQITPNSQTLEAITKHGATSMLWVIDEKHSIKKDDGFLSAREFVCDTCKGKGDMCTDCYGTGKSYDLDCESEEEFIKKYSPLQVGDEFEIVEEIDCNGDCTMGLPCLYCGSSGQGIGKGIVTHFKGKTLSVEVKRVQDLTIADIYNLKVVCFQDYVNDAIEWFESIIGLGAYEKNPYVGLINFKEKE